MHFLAIIILANDSAISSSYSYEVFCHFPESSHAHSAAGLRTVICWWQWCVLLFSSLPLFQLIYFVNCRQTPLQLNSLEPCSSSKGKRKLCHGLLTFSIKCEMWHFQVIVLQWRQRNVQKVYCMCKVHMSSCLLDPINRFLMDILIAIITDPVCFVFN